MDTQYLTLVEKVINKGERRQTRNAVVYSLFGERLVFGKTVYNKNLFPILITKKISIKNVFEELMWFLRGQTNANILRDKGVNIWNGNTTKEFVESRGLDYPEGELGPIYGFQWNHFGAEYIGPDGDYKDKGVNQIDYCIDLIKKDPTSRRILFSAWNPKDIPKMVLPPCHIMFQFYVRDGKYLDGQLYQRSADLMLGVPYNMVSYYLLLLMVGHVTGLEAGDMIMNFGDVHVYADHLDGVMQQIRRKNNSYLNKEPKIYIKPEVRRENIRDFELDDFHIEYEPQSSIRMPMIA